MYLSNIPPGSHNYLYLRLPLCHCIGITDVTNEDVILDAFARAGVPVLPVYVDVFACTNIP